MPQWSAASIAASLIHVEVPQVRPVMFSDSGFGSVTAVSPIARLVSALKT